MITAIFVLFLPLVLLRDLVRQIELARLHMWNVVAMDIAVCAIQIGGLLLEAKPHGSM